MAQSRLDTYHSQEASNSRGKKAVNLPYQQPIKRKKEEHAFPPTAPKNLASSYFVSATYDGQKRKAMIKLYEPTSGRIYFWHDNTGHKPYCLTNLSPYELEKIDRLMRHQGFKDLKIVEKYNALLDRDVKVTKVIAEDPLAIGGRSMESIRDIIPKDFSIISKML